jgi:hypothetical protein
MKLLLERTQYGIGQGCFHVQRLAMMSGQINFATRLDRGLGSEVHARDVVTRMAYLLQASQMLAHSPASVAGMYIQTRLGGDWMHVYGTLPDSADIPGIVERAAVVKH